MGAVYRRSGVDSYLVSPSEPLNARRAEGIRQFFKDLAHKGVRRVVVSLEDVPFIDSQGLAALIVRRKTIPYTVAITLGTVAWLWMGSYW